VEARSGADLQPFMKRVLPARRLAARATASAFVLTVVSAVLYAAAFPPLGLWPVAWIALAPLFAAATLVSPRVGFGVGVVWGVLAAIGVSGWLPSMIASFFEAPLAVGVAAAAGVYLLAATYYGALVAWTSWMAKRASLNPVLLGAAWCTCEFVRASWPLPDPWALLGYSQLGWPTVVQTADLGGPFAVGFLVAVANALVASLFVVRLRGRRPLAEAALAAALLATALGYGSWRLGQHFGEGPARRVALVQGAVERSKRWGPENRQGNLERQLALSDGALRDGSDLIVWPEYAVDFYPQESTALQARLLQVSVGQRAELLFGAPDYDFDQGRTRYFNATYLVRDGRLAGRYHKVHLMPFSEHNPLEAWVGRGKKDLTPGDTSGPLETAIGRVAILLCNEAMFPSYVRERVRLGAEVLVSPANDDWFGDEAAAAQQLAAVSFRAIETRRFLLRSATTGYSAVIDPHGRVVRTTRFGKPDVAEAEVLRSSATPPYQRVGDFPSLAAAAGVCVATASAARRSRARTNLSC